MEVAEKSFNRSERIAELVHRTLAEAMLRHRERDAFTGITITTVKVSGDLASAKIFVTLLDDKNIDNKIAALNNEIKLLRHILAQQLNLRIVPQLFFIYDSLPRYGAHLASVINAAIESDKLKHQTTETKNRN